MPIRFFAWADASQMPLRRFKVDFDNGTDPYVSVNKSQSNYKPYCDDAGRHCGSDSNIPCVADNCASIGRGACIDNAGFKDAFGSEKGSGCMKKYYEVYGQYSCDVGSLQVWRENEIPAEKKFGGGGGGHLAVMRNNPNVARPWEIFIGDKERRAGLSDGTIVCAFRPKVQILDNWGWCSGMCAKSYNAQGAVQDQPSNGCYSELQTPGALLNQCDLAINTTMGISPWIPFGGTEVNNQKNIIVIPATE